MQRWMMACGFFVWAAIGMACGPMHPNCERQENCHTGEHCVLGHCQECAHANDCSSSQRCVQGRCE